MNMFRVSLCSDLDRYLGLPSYIGKSKYDVFESIKEKFWARINNWKNVYLSQAGKQILIKAVALAIPTYATSLF